jgi:hypothetical protein
LGFPDQRWPHTHCEAVMDKRYIELVRLLIKAAPAVLEEGPFALKGGTALNLFLNDLPRLSVDLDLVFIDRTLPRETALRAIAESLATAREKLSRLRIEAEVVPSKSGEECKLFIRHGAGFLKVEVNHVFRGTVRPVETREMVPFAREFFATGIEVRTLAPAELYGSKLVAAMVRQHPRDLFDVHRLYEAGGLTPDIVDCFVCYLAGHNRPVHEVLFSRPADIAVAFSNEFAGMAREPVSFDELLETRERLQSELPAALTSAHRRFLASLVEAEPDWSVAPCPYLSEMPAVRWKLEHLKKLKTSNPAKFVLQSRELKSRLGMGI